MRPIQHPQCNDVLAAPPGVSIDDCRALPIARTVLDGVHVIMSFWQPDAEQLAALAKGAPVVLVIPAGAPHPPIRVEVLGE